MVSTTKGEMDEALLEKREGVIDDEVERTTWIEHWLGGAPGCNHSFDPSSSEQDGSRPCLVAGCDGRLVHRSVDMFLKKAMFSEGFVADFS